MFARWTARTTGAAARIAVAAGILSLALAGARAESITMEQAVDLARQNNLSIKSAAEDYQASLWGVRSAWGSLMPSVSFTSSARRVDPDTYDRANSSLGFLDAMGIEVEPFLYETTYETSFTGSVPLFNGGRLWGGVGLAGATRDAALHSLESVTRSVEVAAKDAYLGVLRTQALLGVAQDAVAASEERVEGVKRKVAIGIAGRSEELLWEVQLAEDRAHLVDAENSVVLARMQFANVLGLPLDASPSPEDISRLELRARVERVIDFLGGGSLSEESARRLLSSNPDFLAPADAARISAHAVTIARGALLPSLNMQATYGWQADGDIDPDDDVAWSVTAFLEVPLFTGLGNISDYNVNKRSHLAALRAQEDAERQMVVALRASAATLQSRLKALDAAERLVAQSEELLSSTENMYDQGMLPNTDLVDARVAYDRSRIGYVNALYDCFVSLAELERFIGRPSMEDR